MPEAGAAPTSGAGPTTPRGTRAPTRRAPGHAPRTVGVEEELMLFADGGNAPAPAGEALAQDAHTAVEHELQLEQAEISSPPVTDLAELDASLRAARAELVLSAARRRVVVAALGTSPYATTPTPTPGERYARMRDRYRGIIDDQLTCGAHVHVGVGSRSEGVRALDGVRPWMSVLLALCANSPYWAGEDTGHASYRTVMWGRWPTAGPTDHFGDVTTYDARVAALIGSGAALDDGMVYFDARLSAQYPTVEFRVADVGQHVEDDVVLAALCRAAVDTAVNADTDRDYEVAILRAASWRAARHGLTDSLYDVVEGRLRPADSMLDRMVDDLGPALAAAGDLDLVRDGLTRTLRRGTGAELQRRDGGTGTAADIVAAATRRTTEARA